MSLRRELHKNADYSRSTRAIIHAANYQRAARGGEGEGRKNEEGREREREKKKEGRQRESISQTGLNPRERRGQRFSLTFDVESVDLSWSSTLITINSTLTRNKRRKGENEEMISCLVYIPTHTYILSLSLSFVQAAPPSLIITGERPANEQGYH